MRTLVRTVSDIPWMPQPHEGRLYITDTLPDLRQCASAFGFVFNGQDLLLTQLRPIADSR